MTDSVERAVREALLAETGDAFLDDRLFDRIQESIVPPRRRTALAVTAASAIAIIGIGAVVFATNDREGEVTAGSSEVVTTLPLPPLNEAESEVLSDGTPVWVVHHEDGRVSVLEAASGHRPFGMAQLVGWCSSSQGFEDPLYGSQFDAYGFNRAGPAPVGLRAFPTGNIVDGTVAVTGPALTAPSNQQHGEPAPGKPCFDPTPEPTEHPGYNPGDLELHQLSGESGVPLEEALDQPDGSVVAIRDATILIVAERPPIACSGPLEESAPPRCDGPEAPDLKLEAKTDWIVAHGTFLARLAGDHLEDITFTAGWTIDQRGGAGDGIVPIDCGSYVIAQGDFDTDAHSSAQTCLIDAFNKGRAATLVYEYPTIEGDPIITTYRVTGRRSIEVQTDMTRDHFSSGGVFVQKCEELEIRGATMSTSSCTEPVGV